MKWIQIKWTVTVPDNRTRKQPCKHIFASLLFSKNRGKQTIEHLDGHSNGNGNGIKSNSQSKSEPESKQHSNKPIEAHSKEFDRQSTKIGLQS